MPSINQLKHNKMKKQEELQNVYVHETHTLFVDSGELHLITDTHSIVFNCDTLFLDLPTIVELTMQGRNEQRKLTIDQLKETIAGVNFGESIDQLKNL